MFKFTIIFLTMSSAIVFSSCAFAEDSKVRKGEIVIIGKTDLPRVSFSIPWQLPTVQKRSEQSPPIRRTRDLLVPTEPERHAQEVQFSESYKVDLSNLSVR